MNNNAPMALLLAVALILIPPALADDPDGSGDSGSSDSGSSDPGSSDPGSSDPGSGDSGDSGAGTCSDDTNSTEEPCQEERREDDGPADGIAMMRPCYVYKIVSYRPDPTSLNPILGMIVLDPNNCYVIYRP